MLVSQTDLQIVLYNYSVQYRPGKSFNCAMRRTTYIIAFDENNKKDILRNCLRTMVYALMIGTETSTRNYRFISKIDRKIDLFCPLIHNSNFEEKTTSISF